MPKQKSQRIRHGKGPSRMPKREKFSSRRIDHEARLLDHSKAKRDWKERSRILPKAQDRSQRPIESLKNLERKMTLVDTNFKSMMRTLMKVQATVNVLCKEQEETRHELARERDAPRFPRGLKSLLSLLYYQERE